MNIQITEAAKHHFVSLIEKEEQPGMALRIFLDRPGFPKAEVGITFCPPGEHRGTDLSFNYDVFTLYVDKASAPFLVDANVDYQEDKLGGQLAISVPNLHGSKPDETTSLEDRIRFILDTEINPNLAGHGGMVSLIEVTPERAIVLKFGGGCHGCGMVDVTLKQGIETTLKEKLPEITAVIDATDHTKGENPYY